MQQFGEILNIGKYFIRPAYKVYTGSMFIGTIAKISEGKFHANPSNKTSNYIREFDSIEIAVKWLGYKSGVNSVDPIKELKEQIEQST